MDHLRLVNALKKAGATVTQDAGRTNAFTAVKGKNRVCWYTQRGYPNEAKLDVSVCSTPSPHTDVMTDCFCDHYHRTIKSAVRELDRA